MVQKLFTIIIFTIILVPSFAQSTNQEDSLSLSIPSLNTVIDLALKHSPLLKAKALNSEIVNQELKIEKKKWLNYIFIEGAANYGLFDQVIISGFSTEGNPSTGTLSKSEQMRYYAGFGLKLPLSAFTSRKNELKIKKLNYQQTKYELQEFENQLRQIIIDEYFKMKYLEESMKTFSNIYQTLEISYLKAEKDVLDGRMNLNDFALLVSTLGKSKDDYNKTKSNFYAQYFKLQELTGVKF